MNDIINRLHGELKVYKKYDNGNEELIFVDKNAITYRAKAVMSRLLAGGLNPNTSPAYQWGTGNNPLRVEGIALGNGGHLIYSATGTKNADMIYQSGTAIVLDNLQISSDTIRPAMPFIGTGTFGYAGQPDRIIPGTSYEEVANGNVPWDGTANITDNSVGVLEPGSTLYSETFRIPLDDDVSADGYQYATKSEVVFKATLDQAYLNNTVPWGFSGQAANIISEAGLIVGYVPLRANLNTGQIYSVDGDEPKTDTTGWTYADGTQTNWGKGVNAAWTTKDGASIDTSSNASGLDKNGTVPPTVSTGADSWPSYTNTWNMIARKTFPGIVKTNAFSLVFVWTIGF